MPTRDQRGFALISCLLISMIIVAIGLNFAYRLRQRLQVTRMMEDRVQADLEAWSALQEVLFLLTTSATVSGGLIVIPAEAVGGIRQHPEEGVFINFYGEPVLWREGVTVAIQDVMGKIPLFGGDRHLLRKLVEYYQPDAEAVNRIMDSLEDWEDEDDFKHVNGAERWQYKTMGRSYEPRNFYCQSPDELLLLWGMTPELYSLIRPHLTYSYLGAFSPFNASPTLLRAILFPNEPFAEQLIELRAKGLFNEGPALELALLQGEEDFAPRSGNILEITVEGRRGRAVSRTTVVYRKTPTDLAPYQFELWKR